MIENKPFKNISAVILSGGKSSRMKQDKSLLRFGEHDTMIQHQFEKLSSIFENVYISTKEKKFDFINEDKLIIDNCAVFSPMVALETIFETLKNKNKIFIITVDMPLVKQESIIKLVEESLSYKEQIIIAKDAKENIHNLCGVFDRSILEKIKESLSKDIHKINHLIKNCSYKELKFKDSQEFLNLNDQEQYKKALKLL